jgi:hypothetical protein
MPAQMDANAAVPRDELKSWGYFGTAKALGRCWLGVRAEPALIARSCFPADD